MATMMYKTKNVVEFIYKDILEVDDLTQARIDAAQKAISEYAKSNGLTLITQAYTTTTHHTGDIAHTWTVEAFTNA